MKHKALIEALTRIRFSIIDVENALNREDSEPKLAHLTRVQYKHAPTMTGYVLKGAIQRNYILGVGGNPELLTVTVALENGQGNSYQNDNHMLTAWKVIA